MGKEMAPCNNLAGLLLSRPEEGPLGPGSVSHATYYARVDDRRPYINTLGNPPEQKD